jgi:hypothetical protein
MLDIRDYCSREAGVDGIFDLVEVQGRTLEKEVQKYCKERSVKA